MNNYKRLIPYIALMGLLVAGSFLPMARAAENASRQPNQIRELLMQVHTETLALSQDSDRLAAMARNGQSNWQGHAEALTRVREHVNRAGELLSQLQDARVGASPWQHQAIDRIHPLLSDLARNTEATINHLTENSHRVRFPEYSQYTRAGADLSEELAQLVGDYVDFGEHEAEYQRLQQKFESSVS